MVVRGLKHTKQESKYKLSNTQPRLVNESSATGEEISAIVSQLEDSLINIPRGHGIIALLSMALILMDPEILPEQLQQGVRDTSHYICLLLDGNTQSEDEPSKIVMN